MIWNFPTKMVRTVRTVASSPILQMAIVTLVNRTCLVVDLLTGRYTPRPAVRQERVRSADPVSPPQGILPPDIPLFFSQR